MDMVLIGPPPAGIGAAQTLVPLEMGRATHRDRPPTTSKTAKLVNVLVKDELSVFFTMARKPATYLSFLVIITGTNSVTVLCFLVEMPLNSRLDSSRSISNGNKANSSKSRVIYNNFILSPSSFLRTIQYVV